MQILIKKVYDYTRALEDRFAPKPNYKRRQEVAALLDKQGKKKLLRLVDAHTVAQEEMALASFIAGVRLAWGIAMELRTDGSYSYEREQEEINRRKIAERGRTNMAKRRTTGEGNIRKRSDGRWEGRYTAGRDLNTGKVIYKNVLAKTQKECKEKLQRAIEENARVDAIRAEQYTVGQWMDVWFENCTKIKVRPSSHKTYRGYIDNHIKPSIGKIPLNKLSSLDLQKLYKKLLSGGRVERVESKKQPKGLSAKTVRNINQVISSAMKFAIDQKLIAANPTDSCAPLKLEHREMKTLPTEQLAFFLHEARESGVFEVYYIELATGLRRGELLGLKWEDIDLERGTIQVHRQIARINGEVVEAPLKTTNSYRSVSIGQDAAEILKEQQRKVDSEYVFPSPTGGPVSPDSVLHMPHRVLKRTGLPQIRFHDMRHPNVKPETKNLLCVQRRILRVWTSR